MYGLIDRYDRIRMPAYRTVRVAEKLTYLADLQYNNSK